MNTQSDYKGWNLFDRVCLVIKNNADVKGYRQAYVVDPSNKKSLEAAKKWARLAKYNINTDSTDYDDAEVFETDNRDFKITLFNSAANSYNQGGKLSFWNCLLEKDEYKLLIGINSDLLLKLLLQSTCINGEIQVKVMFARKDSNVGLLHESMLEYKEALNDKERKVKQQRNKTSVHTVGTCYSSLKKCNLYLGEAYSWIRFTSDSERCINKHIKFLDKPDKVVLFPSLDNLSNVNADKSTANGKEWFDSLYREIDGVACSRMLCLKTNYTKSSWANNWILTKAPSRVSDKKLFEEYSVGDKQYFFDKLRDKFINALEEMQLANDKRRYIYTAELLLMLGISEFDDRKPNLSREHKESILNGLPAFYDVDFGDGLVYSGKLK